MVKNIKYNNNNNKKYRKNIEVHKLQFNHNNEQSSSVIMEKTKDVLAAFLTEGNLRQLLSVSAQGGGD